MSSSAQAPNALPAAGPRGLAIFGGVAAVSTAADLATKYAAFAKLSPYTAKTVIPGLVNLVLSENHGAAFGVLQHAQAFFAVISTVAILVLSYFAFTARGGGPGYQVTLGLVAAGVLGNFYDRLRFHYVRDFLDVYIERPAGAAGWLRDHFGTNHWPTFNVADALICVGVGLLLVRFWREDRAASRAQPAQVSRAA